MKAAKVVLGCSQCTSNAAARAELDIHFQKTTRDKRKLKWRYRLHEMREKRDCQKNRKKSSREEINQEDRKISYKRNCGNN